MSGNEFLKYPPHKNVGSLPTTRYNLMRFQMESAKIPYIKRTFDDGILEVQQIYGTQYKAKWTPIGGNDLCYVVRYYQDAPTVYGGYRRYIFLDKDMRVVGQPYYTEDELNANGLSMFARLSPMEYKVSGDLVLVFRLGYTTAAIINSLTLTFYKISTGQVLSDEYTLSMGYVYSPATTPRVSVNVTGIYVDNDAVYIAKKTGLDKLTISIDPETKQYSFTLTSIVTGVYVYYAEEGLFWKGISAGVYAVIDKDTGEVLYTVEDDPPFDSGDYIGQQGTTDIIKTYLTPEFWAEYYVDYNYKVAPYYAYYRYLPSQTPFGPIGVENTKAASLRCYPRWSVNSLGYLPATEYSEYVEDHGDLFGTRYFRYYNYGATAWNPSSAGLYTRAGAAINEDLANLNQVGLAGAGYDTYDAVRERAYWKGFNRSSELMWLALGYYRVPEGIHEFRDVISWGNIAKIDSDNPIVPLTRAELYTLFSVPADAYDISSVAYLPKLNNNRTICQFLKSYL